MDNVVAFRWARLVQGAAVIALFGFAATAWLYFSAWRGLWLVVVGGVTWFRPKLGVCILFPALSIDLAKPVFGGVFVSYSELEVAVCLLGWLASGQWRSALDLRPLKWVWPFTAAVFLSACLNNEWIRVLPHVVRSSEFALALFLAANAFADGGDSGLFKWPLGAAALMFCGHALVGFVSGESLRMASFFDNPNQFAAYLNLLLPALLILFFGTVGRKVRLLWGGLTMLVVTACLGAQSRSGLAASLVCFGLLWILHYGSRLRQFLAAPLRTSVAFVRRSGIALAATLVIVFAALAVAKESGVARTPLATAWKVLELRSRPQTALEDIDLRVPYYVLGWAIWRDHPVVGIGPGNYKEAAHEYRHVLSPAGYSQRDWEVILSRLHIHVHDLYLQIAVDFGLLGLGAFLYMIGGLLIDSARVRRAGPWGPAALGLLTAFVLQNLLDVTFYSLGLEMGILLGVFRYNRPGGDRPRSFAGVETEAWRSRGAE